MLKQTHTYKTVIATFSALLGAIVLLHGMHVKDLFNVSQTPHIVAKTGEEVVKLLGELHHHIDKQTLKSLAQSADGTMQVDARSLRLLRQAVGQPLRLSILKCWATYLQFWISLQYRTVFNVL
jgi:hypothetical protein